MSASTEEEITGAGSPEDADRAEHFRLRRERLLLLLAKGKAETLAAIEAGAGFRTSGSRTTAPQTQPGANLWRVCLIAILAGLAGVLTAKLETQTSLYPAASLIVASYIVGVITAKLSVWRRLRSFITRFIV